MSILDGRGIIRSLWNHETVVYGRASWTVMGLSDGCEIMRRLCMDEHLGRSWDNQMVVES